MIEMEEVVVDVVVVAMDSEIGIDIYYCY